jgi:hypothetical protein
VLLAVLSALVILGVAAQRNTQVRLPNPPAHSRLVPLQIQAIIFEWATLAWVWFGIRRKGFRVRDLVAGRWSNAKSVLIDILLAVGLWTLWFGVSKAENFFFGQNHAAEAVPYPANLGNNIQR